MTTALKLLLMTREVLVVRSLAILKEKFLLSMAIFVAMCGGQKRPKNHKEALKAAKEFAPDGPVFCSSQKLTGWQMPDYDDQAATEDNINTEKLYLARREARKGVK